MKILGTYLRVSSIKDSDAMLIMVWCPGCDRQHPFWVQDPNRPRADPSKVWTWDGSLEKPTFEPSLLVHSHKTLINADLEGDALIAPENITTTPRCHSFLRNGVWEFLGDCDHSHAGEKMPVVPLPDWLTSG